VNIAEIVENGGSFSGEEFTICDPKRNKGSGAAHKAKSAIKQQATAQRLPPPCAVWLTSGHTRRAGRDRIMDISSACRMMMLKIYRFC